MVPCELCKSLLGRPGYVPPHPRLLRTDDGLPHGRHAGKQVFVYRCQHCQQMIALSTRDDGSDIWTGHDGPGR
ncbi:hypothetical protein GA566_22730 [Cupriavidus sp. SW-Y-13]|nr:hypothetical protein [Cupriavidus sp. SW-Y-13]